MVGRVFQELFGEISRGQLDAEEDVLREREIV